MCCDSGDSHWFYPGSKSFSFQNLWSAAAYFKDGGHMCAAISGLHLPSAAVWLAAGMVRYLVTGESSLWCLCHVELNDYSDYVTVSMMSMSVCWRCENHDGTVSRAWSLPLWHCHNLLQSTSHDSRSFFLVAFDSPQELTPVFRQRNWRPGIFGSQPSWQTETAETFRNDMDLMHRQHCH